MSELTEISLWKNKLSNYALFSLRECSCSVETVSDYDGNYLDWRDLKILLLSEESLIVSNIFDKWSVYGKYSFVSWEKMNSEMDLKFNEENEYSNNNLLVLSGGGKQFSDLMDCKENLTQLFIKLDKIIKISTVYGNDEYT